MHSEVLSGIPFKRCADRYLPRTPRKISTEIPSEFFQDIRPKMSSITHSEILSRDYFRNYLVVPTEIPLSILLENLPWRFLRISQKLIQKIFKKKKSSRIAPLMLNKGLKDFFSENFPSNTL